MRASAARIVGSALVVALLVASASSDAGGVASSQAARSSLPPNIVLVLTDDQRWDTVWAMPTVRDALAGHGVTFENGFVVNPLCCPSRASVLTGKYSHSTGVYLNQSPNGGFGSFDDSTTIATALDSAGYSTALVGKYLSGYGADGRNAGYIPPGWDVWAAFFAGAGYYDYRLDQQGKVVRYGREPADYSTDVLARKAVSFVRTARQPFFLEFTPFAPHGPATPAPRHEHALEGVSWWDPPSLDEPDVADKPAHIQKLGALTAEELDFLERYRRKQLKATLAADDAVRGILRALEERRILTRTFIVFMSDNGVSWGEHTLIAGRKADPYEEQIRVPLVIRYDPLTGSRARDESRLALNVDLAPTFADLAGVRLPGAEGRSLLPLLRSRSGSRTKWRRDFLVEHLAGLPYRSIPTYCAVRNARYKYVLYQTGEEELYDLAFDPHELSNQAGFPSTAVMRQTLRARLDVLCRPRPPGYTVLDEPVHRR